MTFPDTLTGRAAFSAAAVSVAALGAAGTHLSANAADGAYVTEASFLAAASGTTVESFEALAARSRSLAPIVTSGFTITTAGAPIGVQTGLDTPEPGFGGSATDGTRWVSVYLPNLSQGNITFTFARPTLSFGLNLSDIGETSGTVRLTTNLGFYAGGTTLLSFPPTQGNGAINFIGLTQNTAFTSVSLTVSGVDDAYGLDKVYISAVPAPAAALSWLFGLPGLALAVRCSARRA